MDWRDLRIALAVERHGTLAAAGAVLDMDPTTVSRRITNLEEALGATLFRRGAEGLVPTPAGRVVVEHAARMAEEARALRHDVDLAAARVEGKVRVTTLDEVAIWYLAPHLSALHEQHPGLHVELLCTEKVLDLARGRADVAVRLGRPTEPGLRVRRLGEVEMGLYASRAFLARRPVPTLPCDAPVELVAVGPVERPLSELRWAMSLLPRARVVANTNSFPVTRAMVIEGVGVGVLPVLPAEAAGLVRLDGGAHPPERPVWRAVPEALADAPRIKAVLDWLDGLPL